jgi:hypothetical protein
VAKHNYPKFEVGLLLYDLRGGIMAVSFLSSLLGSVGGLVGGVFSGVGGLVTNLGGLVSGLL